MNRLKELREEKGLLQREVADILGVSRPAYNHWENGKIEIDFTNLKKLADFYNVTIDYIIGCEPTEQNMSVVNNALKFAQDVGLTDEKIKNLTPQQLKKIKTLIDIVIDKDDNV